MLRYLIGISSIFLMASCGSSVNQETMDSSMVANDSVPKKKIEPIWGHRYQITGDFDGDGIQDTLTEHYYSYRDKEETNKYYSESMDFESIDSAIQKQNHGYVLCSNTKLDTVPIGGIIGLYWLKNEGDLDGDGADEISAVSSTHKGTNIGNCDIYSYKKGAWRELYTFKVHEHTGAEIDFLGWIKKLSTGKIEVHTLTFMGDDTTLIVRLKK